MGEYLQLDGKHYRFDSISHQGEYITLVREPNFAAQVGTQVGMLAPPFELVTLSEDTLRSAEMLDRPIVLANSCGCGGDKASGDAVAAIRNAYGSEIHALRLDSGYETIPDGYNVNVEHPFNQDVYQQYRKVYCSRVAYLVGRDNRILDKFNVTDWEEPLARHLQP